MKLRFQHRDTLISIDARPIAGGWIVVLPDGSVHTISASRSSSTELDITQRQPHAAAESEAGWQTVERRYRIPVARTKRGIEIAWQGRTFVFESADAIRSSAATPRSSGSVTAPMPGVVANVLVVEGQEVAQYQPVAVVEAMKVMATLEAPFAGIVSKVSAAKGSQVALGDLLVEISPAKSG